MAVFFGATLTLWMGACGPPDRQPSSGKGDSIVSPVKSDALAAAGVPQAAASLNDFLEHAVLTSPEAVPDSLVSCDWSADSVLALAAFKVLRTERRGDTVDATAEVLTVAEEHPIQGRANAWVASLRIRTDTLRWKMTRHQATGRWAVCGYSVQGYGFVRHGYDVPGGTERRWIPLGASYGRARQLVDSIRRQRDKV